MLMIYLKIADPIYKSDDWDATWFNFSAVYDQVNGWGMRFQPFLYILPIAFGCFPAGTILAAGVPTPRSLEGDIRIELYASIDQAETFNLVSHVAYGNGPDIATNGNAAIWEPFILYYNSQIIVYYSDQHNIGVHGQQLRQQTTTDLETWSSAVDIEADSNATARPGMETVFAHTETNCEGTFTFELFQTDNYNVHYKISPDPLSFGAAQSQKLTTTTGATPVSAPYIIWTQNPAKTDGSGILIPSAIPNEQIFSNEDSANSGNWEAVDVAMWSA